MLKRRILPVTFVAAALLLAAAASAAIPAAERQALTSLYTSAGGSGWTRRTGWNGAAGTECSWYGITCDAAGAHVTGINLDGNNLAGTLPSLSGLGSLLYLILPNNHLTGAIPPVSSLTGLRILELYANDLSGSIPSLAGLSALTSLELNSNGLTGAIPDLSSLASLQVFDLDTNTLTGPVPSLSAMTQLQYMALDTNALSGTFPGLSALTQLADCELYDNQFTGPVPSLSGLSHLATLLLSNNRFSGAFPNVTGVPLETLDLDYNALTGPIPSTVGNATTLVHLYCAGNDLTGALPATLGNLTKLESGGSDFGYNGLFTSNATLAAFLDARQQGGDWRSTQTIAPAGVSAASATNNAARIAWTPIAYSADSGGYGIYLSKTSGGPYALALTTSGKAESSATVTGLTPATNYFAVVRTTTNSNPNNANVVSSADSAPVAFSTTSCGGCALAPSAVLVEGVSPFPPPAGEPNGIFEPGESAAVSPSWIDAASGAVNGVTGTALSLSGPSNGTTSYSLPKNSATYGDFSPGGTRSCAADCYQARITADIRPAAHWDAFLTETLNSSETHTWTLHLGNTFSDAPSSYVFYAFIEDVLHHGITVGCAPRTPGDVEFCPNDGTRRGEMAAFIARAETGSDAAVPASGTVPGLGAYDCTASGVSLFSDVQPTDGFCRHIHFIASRGDTFGCADTATAFPPHPAFCVNDGTTRGALAVFIARDLAGGDAGVPASGSDAATGRAYDCADGNANAFPDVADGDPLCKYVYSIWSKGIIDGFPDGTFGPSQPVRRGETAKFLVNAYRLVLGGPQ